MTVRELINELLDCPMDAEVRLQTSNKDIDNRFHVYGKVALNKTPILDTLGSEHKHFINLTFHNWELEVKADET